MPATLSGPWATLPWTTPWKASVDSGQGSESLRAPNGKPSPLYHVSLHYRMLPGMCPGLDFTLWAVGTCRSLSMVNRSGPPTTPAGLMSSKSPQTFDCDPDPPSRLSGGCSWNRHESLLQRSCLQYEVTSYYIFSQGGCCIRHTKDQPFPSHHHSINIKHLPSPLLCPVNEVLFSKLWKEVLIRMVRSDQQALVKGSRQNFFPMEGLRLCILVRLLLSHRKCSCHQGIRL